MFTSGTDSNRALVYHYRSAIQSNVWLTADKKNQEMAWIAFVFFAIRFLTTIGER